MKYALLIYSNEPEWDDLSDDEKAAIYREYLTVSETAGVTGVALTKLDGSAKGGVAIPIAYELGLPVKLIGVGEQLDDLRPFDPTDFARALVGV